jgi:hypothetical protein
MHRVCQRTTAGGDHGPVKSAWRDAAALPTERALDGSDFVVEGADATMQRVWSFVECAAAAEVGDEGGVTVVVVEGWPQQRLDRG